MILAASVAACAENVLIGINPREDSGVPTDGGAGLGGGSAGGSIVAGGSAGGTSGGAAGGASGGMSGGVAGGFSGGSAGGASGGMSGGGVAGGSAGGAADAGFPSDGGPADFVLELQAPLCLEPAEVATLVVRAANVGGSVGIAAGVVTIPSAFLVQASGGCVVMGAAPDASVWGCDGGQVGPGSGATVGAFQLQAPAAAGMYAYRARSGDAGEQVAFSGVTGVGAVSLDPTLGGRWDAGACQGLAIMNINMCMPGDLVRDTLRFLPDASVISDDGIPATWGQSPARRNLCFQSFGPFGGNFFRGTALSPRCFGGFADSWLTGETHIAAWEMCF